jgi:4-amino-4-deoxy-L-arabinose transferase-like glycosyltransferase
VALRAGPAWVDERVRQLAAGDVCVVALTALAFALRAAGVGQALYGDELFTHHIVTSSSLAEVLRLAGPGEREATPPLFFVLAWAGAQLGDPLVWVRAPSLILGTATVPVVYLVGLRTVGRHAALVGAAVVSLGPFAIFYSTEARAYATLLFLTTLSTLALLAALDTSRRGWWVAFALSSCAALYTHYTAIFLVAGEVVWAAAFHRDRIRELLVASAGIALLFLPWLPRIPDQRAAAARVEVGTSARSPGEQLEDLLRLVTGHPFLPLDRLPGVAPLAICGVAVAAAVTGLAVAHGRRRLAAARTAAPRLVLLAGLALALPVGLSLYGLVGKDVYNLKTIIVSLPAIALLLGLLVARLEPAPLRVGVGVMLLAGLGLATLGVLDRDNRRPPWNEVAAFIEQRAKPNDEVLQFDPVWYVSNDPVALGSLDIHLDAPRVTFAPDERSASRSARGRRVFFASARLPGTPPRVLRLRWHRIVGSATFAGFNPVTVYTYAPLERRAGG